MTLNKVDLCGVNTSGLPLLSDAEKEELFQRIQNGDTKARTELIIGNLRLVLSVLKRFNNTSENADDLFQIGCIGLIKAIDNFDTSLGVKFSTYAVPMILGEVKRYLRDDHTIRVSRSLKDTAYKAMYAKEMLLRENDKEPTLEEIAEAIDMSASEVLLALDAISTPLSLYEPVYQDDGDNLYLMDQVHDKKSNEDAWVNDFTLKNAISHLNERENAIIRLRFFEGKTQTEVANEIAMSQAQVSRLEKGALKNLKKWL